MPARPGLSSIARPGADQRSDGSVGGLRHEQAFSIEVPSSSLDALGEEASLVVGSHTNFLHGIATSLATSVPASDLDATFVVRGDEHARPAIGVIGSFSSAQASRVEVLADSLGDRLRDVRYVGYRDARALTEKLADQLEKELGRTGIDEASFVAIPRGGHIVLGMLAMTLGLRAEQLRAESGTDATTTVVVDDCALTGHRFGTWLAESAAENIVFAALLGPRDLGAALLNAEAPRVLACLVGEWLDDRGPARHGAGYVAWRDSWAATLDPPRYVVADLRPFAFAWKEPDHSLWNEVTGRREPGWRILPPSLCLGNGRGPAEGRVQVQPAARGPIRPADDVLHVRHAGRTIVGSDTSRRAVALDGVADDLWAGLLTHGTLAGTVAWLSERYDADEAQLRGDVERFVADLGARGLVVGDDGS